MKMLLPAALAAATLAQPLAAKPAATEAAATHVLPDEAAVRAALDPLVAPYPGMAIAVAIIGPGGDTTLFHAPATGYDGATRFEIGSVTKSMTGMLLALLTAEGTVSLDDPVNRYLPSDHQLPDGGDGRAITLGDLSRHRSGLPRMPADFLPAQPYNPYATYDDAALLASIDATDALDSAPGSTVAYSNFGVAILGLALERATGTPYAELLEQRLFGPLGMTAVLGDSDDAPLAQPHGAIHNVQSDWDLGAMGPAGGARATIGDMARFARLYLDRPAPFDAAIPLLFEGAASDGLGLFRRRFGDREIVWHNGATGGSRSMMALDPDRGEAVVVMINSHAGTGPEDLALHFLLGRALPDTE
ncbi:serine hydrolase domain-containing protein [Sphingomicrobium aestuariivivum]|uniref:serine hydrolase domain-containing protein n=1 Tax=Sphingomicrobium aestuariivivum TaxID=1582356 RepID=UPI001FD6FB75|nr:serine hydrolase domain-containing protein [Sphingomicrobium aestuariivivum]MCJ8191934.1 beta-lactamase family protein [Sphingomicrobium aestuariivivum]